MGEQKANKTMVYMLKKNQFGIPSATERVENFQKFHNGFVMIGFGLFLTWWSLF